jgi:translation initiation factor 2A
LHILTIDGISENVSRSKDGPIHDVKWSPVDNQFIVSAGNMPSHTTLYDGKGTPLYEFGAAHRNTLSYAPHGRFVCIAGFGNLAGDMDFYEITKKMKIGSNNSHCAIKYGWSPDSRYFMTSTLAPRMNVDNGFKVFKYNGSGPVLSHDPGAGPVLFDANWRPAATGIYPDRPRTPVKRSNDSSSDSKANSAPVPPPKPAAYR